MCGCKKRWFNCITTYFYAGHCVNALTMDVCTVSECARDRRFQIVLLHIKHKVKPHTHAHTHKDQRASKSYTKYYIKHIDEKERTVEDNISGLRK